MTSRYFTENEILAAIILKYGSQSQASKSLGISTSTMSRNIKRASPKFVERLLQHGVDFDFLLYSKDNPSSTTIPKHILIEIEKENEIIKKLLSDRDSTISILQDTITSFIDSYKRDFSDLKKLLENLQSEIQSKI